MACTAMFTLLAIVSTFSGILAASSEFDSRASCPYPNGTANNFHWYNCNNRDVIQVAAITLTDGHGQPDYPIDPHKKIRLELHSSNNGQTTYNADTVDVHLYQYKKGWTGHTCRWHEVPTLGLLNGLNGCQFANNCPLRPGALDLTIQVDLSPYAAIIDLLSGHSAYEIQVVMKDNNAGSRHEEIACVTSQLRFNI